MVEAKSGKIARTKVKLIVRRGEDRIGNKESRALGDLEMQAGSGENGRRGPDCALAGPL